MGEVGAPSPQVALSGLGQSSMAADTAAPNAWPASQFLDFYKQQQQAQQQQHLHQQSAQPPQPQDGQPQGQQYLTSAMAAPHPYAAFWPNQVWALISERPSRSCCARLVGLGCLLRLLKPPSNLGVAGLYVWRASRIWGHFPLSATSGFRCRCDTPNAYGRASASAKQPSSKRFGRPWCRCHYPGKALRSLQTLFGNVCVPDQLRDQAEFDRKCVPCRQISRWQGVHQP